MKSIQPLLIASCFVFAMLFSGCSVHNPVDIQLAPEIIATEVVQGDEAPSVFITVLDERPSQTIGMRGAHNMGGQINAKGNVPDLIKAAIQSGLEDENFKIESIEQADTATLLIEIRDISYEIISGVWSGTARSESAMKAICAPVNGESYKKLYRGVNEVKGLQLVPDENEIPPIISKAVADNINNLINDKKLVNCLSN